MGWLSMISELIALIVTPYHTSDSCQETPVRASTLLDAPKQSTRHVHYEDNILKPGRRGTLSGTGEHQDKTAIETGPKTKPKTKPIPINRSARLVGDERRHRGLSPGREETIDSGQSPLGRQGARRRYQSPEPFRAPMARQKGVANKKIYVEYIVRDTEPWDEYDNDDYNEYSSDEEVRMEPNPLQDYPHVDESTFLWKMEVKTPAAAGRSLLTEKLSAYATLTEADDGLAQGIQDAIRRQGMASRAAMNQLRRLEAEGEKARIPVCMKGPPERWEIEVSEF